MGLLHYGKPLRGSYLEGADATSDMVYKYLCPASGKGVEACLGEAEQDVGDSFPR